MGGFPENEFYQIELYQILEGTRKPCCGFLATGCGTTGDDRLVRLFWSVRIDGDGAGLKP